MSFQNKCLPIWAAFVLLLMTTGCKRRENLSPDNYRLDHPQKNLLGKALDEISGICFAQKNTLLAVSDSKEKIFEIHLASRKLKDHTNPIVESNADLEDVVQVDSSIYLLESKGVIKEIKDGAKDSAGMKTYVLPLPGKNDFETLYYDSTAGGLIMLCKTCAHEKGTGVRTAYRFDLTTKTFDSTAFFTIDKSEVRRLLKNADAKFDPSAAAVHPLNKRLYILSSAGNLLVVADTRGKVIDAYDLNPDVFPQAEGIAFAPNGDMYISNEKKNGAPTLLFFPYNQSGKKKDNP
ncbi:SdiA-regulated domain-containing protein [Flavisolibacter ginsenosidimutans]|nr:SdiA-regulated domain-containing protein [Flavisolibacter ginsenosidimutans]